MAPKDVNSRKIDPSTENTIEDDIEEIAIVSESLDTLATALDMIEERADRIRAQLLELLTSNREILSLIREENSKLLDPDDSTTRERHDSDN